MRYLLLVLTGLFCTALWLSLLEATGFSAAVISLGLIGVLYVTGRA